MPLSLPLSPDQRTELGIVRDSAPEPYLRERAAALLKIADGAVAAVVARGGLLRPRQPDTVYRWYHRYQAEGVAGLRIRSGRGRKPAFFPSARHRRRGQGSAAASAGPDANELRPGA